MRNSVVDMNLAAYLKMSDLSNTIKYSLISFVFLCFMFVRNAVNTLWQPMNVKLISNTKHSELLRYDFLSSFESDGVSEEHVDSIF
jgi:hypothetical protein